MFRVMPDNNYWLVTQAVLFQLIWLTSVLGGNGLLLVPVLLIAVHFMLTPSPKIDAKLVLLAIPGVVIDGMLTLFGVYVFTAVPVWLLLLWVGFVLNFGHSLRILTRLRLPWLTIVGFLGGVYAYWISWQLGAVAFPYGGLLSCLLIGVYWAVLLPILIMASRSIISANNERS